MRHKSYSDGTNIAIFNVLWGKLSSHLERALRMVKLQDVVGNRNEPSIRTRIASLRPIGSAFMGSFCPDSVVPSSSPKLMNRPSPSQLSFFLSKSQKTKFPIEAEGGASVGGEKHISEAQWKESRRRNVVTDESRWCFKKHNPPGKNYV